MDGNNSSYTSFTGDGSKELSIINQLVIARATDTTYKKNHLLSALVRVLQFKKQIRYKRQIKDTLHSYTKRYIATK